MKSRVGVKSAAVALALGLTGCAGVSPSLPPGVVTRIEEACGWVRTVGPVLEIISGALPSRVSVPAEVALRFLSSTCANPPTDLVGSIGAIENAVSAIEQALNAGVGSPRLGQGERAKAYRELVKLRGVKARLERR